MEGIKGCEGRSYALCLLDVAALLWVPFMIGMLLRGEFRRLLAWEAREGCLVRATAGHFGTSWTKEERERREGGDMSEGGERRKRVKPKAVRERGS